jgi:hypothetical protein
MMETIVLKSWKPRPQTLEIVYLAKMFAEAQQPVTVRQTFYHLVSIGKIPNSEKSYDNLDRILTMARVAGLIPFGWFVDLSTVPLIAQVYPNIEAFLTEKVEYYYRDTWRKQQAYIMIWLEKQALQSILWPIAYKYNVPLFVGKGYSSWSLIIDAAKELKKKAEQGKELVILYFGDYDPSGEDMTRDLLNRLSQIGVEVELVKVALTREQIESFNLPHQPVKGSDTRSKNFESDYAVELDALEPMALRELIERAIVERLDTNAFETDQQLESLEKSVLREKVKEIVDALEPEQDENKVEDGGMRNDGT